MEEKHINEIFRKNLIKYLKQSKRTQKELADYLGITTSMVSLYTTGKNTPRIGRVDKIAQFFNINRSDLIGNIEETPAQPSDISTKLEEMMQELANQKEALMFRGEPMDDETKEAVLLSMQQAMRFAEMSMKNKDKKEE